MTHYSNTGLRVGDGGEEDVIHWHKEMWVHIMAKSSDIYTCNM